MPFSIKDKDPQPHHKKVAQLLKQQQKKDFF